MSSDTLIISCSDCNFQYDFFGFLNERNLLGSEILLIPGSIHSLTRANSQEDTLRFFSQLEAVTSCKTIKTFIIFAHQNCMHMGTSKVFESVEHEVQTLLKSLAKAQTILTENFSEMNPEIKVLSFIAVFYQNRSTFRIFPAEDLAFRKHNS